MTYDSGCYVTLICSNQPAALTPSQQYRRASSKSEMSTFAWCSCSMGDMGHNWDKQCVLGQKIDSCLKVLGQSLDKHWTWTNIGQSMDV